jgi:hypothetical protein
VRLRHGKRGGQGLDRRFIQVDYSLGRPSPIGPGCFGPHGVGQLSRIALLLESEVHFRTACFPNGRGCIGAGRLLRPDKTSENVLHFPQSRTVARLVNLHSGGHEMCSWLPVL